MEPLIRNPPRLGKPLYNVHLYQPDATLVYYFTSEIGTTSPQGHLFQPNATTLEYILDREYRQSWPHSVIF